MTNLSPRIVVTPRDIEILMALDRSPLTARQILKLSNSFDLPVTTERRVRERLQQFERIGWVHSWPYATTAHGGSPHYWKLTHNGFRLFHGSDMPLPSRRHFEEIGISHHHHTMSLADFIVQTFVAAHRLGIEVRHFARENSVRLESAGSVLFPDCAFQLFTRDGRAFNFVVELDNGTERIRSSQDIESIERKLRGYDLHQSSIPSFDHGRFVVLFVTTRSADRLTHILEAAARIMRNPKRTLFLGVTLSEFLNHDAPLTTPIFRSPIDRQQSLIPSKSPNSPRNVGRGSSPARKPSQVPVAV